jgi:hypothetical protein
MIAVLHTNGTTLLNPSWQAKKPVRPTKTALGKNQKRFFIACDLVFYFHKTLTLNFLNTKEYFFNTSDNLLN